MNDRLFVNEIFSSIQGEGRLAGCRQIFIRLVECNLDCLYCDTDHSKQETCRIETSPGSGIFSSIRQPVTFRDLTSVTSGWCDSLPGAHHSFSITGGEPLMHADALAGLIPALRQILPVHLETNGTMHIALSRIISHLDYISMDMKLPSTSGCTEHLWDLHRLFLKTSVGHNASVKVVVGNETEIDEIRQVCGIIAYVDRSTPLYLQPLSLPDGTLGITLERIFLLQQAASALLPEVRVIPQMHRFLGVL